MGQIGRAVHGLVRSGRQSDGRYSIEQTAIDRHGTENSTIPTQQVRKEDNETCQTAIRKNKEVASPEENKESNQTTNEEDIRPQTTENKKVKIWQQQRKEQARRQREKSVLQKREQQRKRQLEEERQLQENESKN